MYLPPMNESFSYDHEIPVVCRLVFRNPVTNLRSDMNGLDLYTVHIHFSLPFFYLLMFIFLEFGDW
jgi:hypothetical protein